MSSEDLKPMDVGQLSWQDDKAEESLKQVFDYVVAKANDAIGWYSYAKRGKKWKAVLLRVLSIIIAAIAGVIPVLSSGAPFGLTIDATWAYVFAALAGAFILVDRVFGHSSGWMRYIKTMLQINQDLNEFQLDWETQRAAWQGDQPTEKEIQAMLTRAKALVVSVDTIVQKETEEWATEFQASLKQFDAQLKQLRADAKSAVDAGQPGSLDVVVENGEQSDDGWQLFIDGEQRRETYRGKTAAVLDLKPGRHAVRVTGKIGGKDKQAEKVATVSAAGVSTVKLTLN